MSEQTTEGAVCVVDGCTATSRKRGWCETHYKRHRRTGTTDDPVRNTRLCEVDGCGRKHERRGLCAEHFMVSDIRRGARRDLFAASPARRERTRARHRSWRQQNRAAYLLNARRWAQEHPERRRQQDMGRRARKLANGVHVVTERDIDRLVIRHGGRCAYCPAALASGFHLDHIVPLARGGHHAIGNLAPACPDCNLSKGKLLLTEWRKRRQAQPLHPNPSGLASRGALCI